jgi:phosphatidylinositol alpha-1,6-mannosyltransferase
VPDGCSDFRGRQEAMSRPLRIAFLHFWTLRLRRGVETLVMGLANELAVQGVDVSIVTAKGSQPPLFTPSSRLRVHAIPTFRYFEFATIAPFYALDLIQQRYDFVVTFFADFGEGWALRLASRLAQPRLCLYLTFPYEAAPHRYRAYEKWCWGDQATYILADAEYTARSAFNYFHRPIHVVPSGTDTDRFKPDGKARRTIRNQFGFEDQDIVLLNVAALEERKGINRVIEALPGVISQVPTIRYLIMGEGPERQRLGRRAAELGLGERVVFGGTTTNLPGYYNASDVFVLLSDAEAGSVACLEAMASGLPAVVSDTGGFSEVVSARCGRIVDPQDGFEIIKALVEMAQDRELRETLGQEGRRVMLDRFSWQVVAKQLLRILKKDPTLKAIRPDGEASTVDQRTFRVDRNCEKEGADFIR